jgi:hypothetical protein
MRPMQIRQLAVNYVPEHDRMLLRVHTGAQSQLFAVWLTRRLCQRLWPHLTQAVRTLGVAQALQQAAPHAPSVAPAALVPEARSMLHDAARRDALGQTDFSKPFDAAGAQRPLGDEPLLAAEVELTQPREGAPRALQLSIRDATKRQVQLSLTPPMAIAVVELMQAALRKADWGFGNEPEAPVAAAPVEARLLN